jgi:hypothetical protein
VHEKLKFAVDRLKVIAKRQNQEREKTKAQNAIHSKSITHQSAAQRLYSA